MMRPEDVADELVEKAMLAWHRGVEGGDDDCDCLADSDVIDEYRKAMRGVLAAVLPDIQAQALREAADFLDRPRVIWYGDGGVTVLEAGADATLDDYRAERPTVVEWLRARAGRLADTSEGTTT